MKSKKLSRLFKIQAVVFTVIIAAGACSVGAFAYNCSRVRSDVLRMHVIANSDSDGDQALKLKVRDAVLERGAELFDGTVTADEAKAKIEPQKAELEAAAREVIEREGYDYPVSVNVVNEYFATRCYGSLTMPAGRYTAVKVVIGEGSRRCACLPRRTGEAISTRSSTATSSRSSKAPADTSRVLK